jgi:hypothetical protein
LIAILIVSVASLLLSATQLGLALRGTGSSASASSLPSRYSDEELRRIATSVTDPYNRDDIDSIYNAFDEVARNQVPRQKIADSVATLRKMLGNVDSVTYVGFKALPHEGTLPLYQLNYSVKLSGGTLPNGTMQINVIDRPAGPGIVGFIIYGKAL